MPRKHVNGVVTTWLLTSPDGDASNLLLWDRTPLMVITAVVEDGIDEDRIYL